MNAHGCCEIPFMLRIYVKEENNVVNNIKCVMFKEQTRLAFSSKHAKEIGH